MKEVAFINTMLGNTAGMWNPTAVYNNALRTIPDSLLGDKIELLRADIQEQWGSWFLEGVADPMRYVSNGKGYSHIVNDVKIAIRSYFPNKSISDTETLIKVVSELVRVRVEYIQAVRKRTKIPLSERSLMLDLVANKPRCWICGYEFSNEAVNSFREGTKYVIPTPQFVDVLKPSGLKHEDLYIEVDHILPFALGGEGENNLRIACGWCNRQKSSLESIYQVKGGPIKAGSNKLGLGTLPQKFWVVRLLGLSTTCEYQGGCTASTKTHEMTVAPRNPYGALNPNNLHVTCQQHHPLGSDILQPRDIVSKMWGIEEREF